MDRRSQASRYCGKGRHPVFYGVHKYGPTDVMSSATTAAQREHEAPPFTVVESKGGVRISRCL